jgi:hypothetical protein
MTCPSALSVTFPMCFSAEFSVRAPTIWGLFNASRLPDRGRSVARRCSSSWSARWPSGNSAGGGDDLFTQPVHGDGSDDLRVLGADLVPALDPLALVSLQSRRDQRNHPVGDDLVAGGADMKRVIKDLALGGIEHIA